ncbi:MAG: ATP-dependent helicase [Burkholderiaceae bacterium]|nr:ATP-dependent helicase [Roseateles sp.]MBV8470134.1 ATP-dependent helicase [Burkholderiaceae bacterium]
MTEDVFEPLGFIPSSEQRAIQLARLRHIVVEANAGATKTTTLALRMAQALHRGAEPERLLGLTYTQGAVDAWRAALLRMGVGASVARRLRLMTFDDFSTACLQGLEGPGCQKFAAPEQLKPSVLDAMDWAQTRVEERFPQELTLQGPGAVESLLRSFAVLKGCMSLADEAGARAWTPESAQEMGLDYATLRVFQAHEQIRRGEHPDRPEFRAPGDATYDLALLLKADEPSFDPRSALAQGQHLVLVDEMHDTNRAMFTVLAGLLAANPRAGFVGVGDRDQVIHSGAGADAAFMGRSFDQEIGPATRMPLSLSFRFGPAVAQAAGRLARKPYAATQQAATDVRLIPYADPPSLYRDLVARIQRREGLAPDAALSDIAVLVRQPDASIPLENHLLQRGVDYRTVGFNSYLQRPETLLLRALIHHARREFHVVERPAARLAMLQALMLFSGAQIEGLTQSGAAGAQAQLRVMEEVSREPTAHCDFIDNQILRNAVPEVRACLQGALHLVEQDDLPQFCAKLLSQLRPRWLAARFLVRQEDVAQTHANLQRLLDFAAEADSIEAFARVTHMLELRQQTMGGKQALVLSSIEAAKGLEFDHVMLPALNQGEFAIGGDSPENRNLLYVAMTRARRCLSVFYQSDRPSAYLRDAGLLS